MAERSGWRDSVWSTFNTISARTNLTILQHKEVYEHKTQCIKYTCLCPEYITDSKLGRKAFLRCKIESPNLTAYKCYPRIRNSFSAPIMINVGQRLDTKKFLWIFSNFEPIVEVTNSEITLQRRRKTTGQVKKKAKMFGARSFTKSRVIFSL